MTYITALPPCRWAIERTEAATSGAGLRRAGRTPIASRYEHLGAYRHSTWLGPCPSRGTKPTSSPASTAAAAAPSDKARALLEPWIGPLFAIDTDPGMEDGIRLTRRSFVDVGARHQQLRRRAHEACYLCLILRVSYVALDVLFHPHPPTFDSSALAAGCQLAGPGCQRAVSLSITGMA